MTPEELLTKIDEVRLPGPKADWSKPAQEAREVEMRGLVAQAKELGIYPEDTVPGNPNSVIAMVRGYGARWFEYTGPLECKHCKSDLRDLKAGPPFKREIGMYDRGLDRTVGLMCPDCRKSVS